MLLRCLLHKESTVQLMNCCKLHWKYSSTDILFYGMLISKIVSTYMTWVIKSTCNNMNAFMLQLYTCYVECKPNTKHYFLILKVALLGKQAHCKPDCYSLSLWSLSCISAQKKVSNYNREWESREYQQPYHRQYFKLKPQCLNYSSTKTLSYFLNIISPVVQIKPSSATKRVMISTVSVFLYCPITGQLHNSSVELAVGLAKRGNQHCSCCSRFPGQCVLAASWYQAPFIICVIAHLKLRFMSM